MKDLTYCSPTYKSKANFQFFFSPNENDSSKMAITYLSLGLFSGLPHDELLSGFLSDDAHGSLEEGPDGPLRLPNGLI